MGKLSRELQKLGKGTIRKVYVDWDICAIVALPQDENSGFPMFITFGPDEMELAFEFMRPMIIEYANAGRSASYDSYINSKSKHDLPDNFMKGKGRQ